MVKKLILEFIRRIREIKRINGKRNSTIGVVICFIVALVTGGILKTILPIHFVSVLFVTIFRVLIFSTLIYKQFYEFSIRKKEVNDMVEEETGGIFNR